MIQKDHPRSRHATDPPSDAKVVCSWCNDVVREGSGRTTHVICPECFEREVKAFKEIQVRRAKRGKEPRPPPPEEFRGPFYFIEGQLLIGFAVFILLFLGVMAAEGLHWLTGGKVPNLIDWQPKNQPVHTNFKKGRPERGSASTFICPD